jgi:hypothetical protein
MSAANIPDEVVAEFSIFPVLMSNTDRMSSGLIGSRRRSFPLQGCRLF